MLFKRFILIVCLICLISCDKNNTRALKLDLLPGINEVEIIFEGVERKFSLIIPDNYDSSNAYPILFYFHGLGGNKLVGENVLSSMTAHNDFIGISPQGYLNSWNSGMGGVPSEEMIWDL